MDIFTEINQFDESTIATRLGMKEAADGKSYECPICGHGKHGNGVKQKYNSHFGRLNWWCHTCARNYSNVDYIAAVENIDPCNASALAERLREMFSLEAVDERKKSSFSSRKKEADLAKAPRNFAAFYKRCRINYSLRKFVEECGGNLRGLIYETLSAAKCMYHSEYTFDTKKPTSPVLIVPYDDELFYWRRLDEVPEGEQKGGVPTGTKRKPYIAAPLSPDMINLIVESEIDALSIKQVFEKYGVGIIATGGAQYFRPTVAEIQRQFGESERRPSFIVLYDNDEAGAKYGETLTAALRASKFPTEQFYFACRMKGEYTGAHGVTKYQPKVDTNDLLREGEDVLARRLIDIIDMAGIWLDMQSRKFKEGDNHGGR